MHTELLIIPACGWSDDDGKYNPGNRIPLIGEADVIQAYVLSLLDELELENIRYQLVQTLGHPGIRESERLSRVEGHMVAVLCGCGWFGQPRGYNASVAYFNTPHAKPLAQTLVDAMSLWGFREVSETHRNSGAKDSKAYGELAAGASLIRIEPFGLNGPNPREYSGRLESLGRTLGRALSSHLKAVLPHLARKTLSGPWSA